MSGDFICEEEYGYKKGVAGGNFFVMGETQGSALLAAQAAVDAIAHVEGCITPFPGGIVASGSKVGSQYKFMKASTNEKMSPSLKGKVASSSRLMRTPPSRSSSTVSTKPPSRRR